MINLPSMPLRLRFFTFTVLLFTVLMTLQQGYAMDRHFSSGDSRVSLLELFTSEGCSSCPPAEKWMNTLKDDERLWTQFVPVAFHVDYWDYIGWKDPFATSENGIRQRQYRQQGNISTVYTPGMLLNGKEWRSWHYKRSVPLSGGVAGNLDVVLNDNRLMASYVPADKQPAEWELNVAILGFGLHSNINAGENAGRRLDQEFVVLRHQQIVSTDGNWSLKLPALNKQQATRTGLAVWVNKKGTQTPIQATGGWL